MTFALPWIELSLSGGASMRHRVYVPDDYAKSGRDLRDVTPLLAAETVKQKGGGLDGHGCTTASRSLYNSLLVETAHESVPLSC